MKRIFTVIISVLMLMSCICRAIPIAVVMGDTAIEISDAVLSDTVVDDVSTPKSDYGTLIAYSTFDAVAKNATWGNYSNIFTVFDGSVKNDGFSASQLWFQTDQTTSRSCEDGEIKVGIKQNNNGIPVVCFFGYTSSAYDKFTESGLVTFEIDLKLDAASSATAGHNMFRTVTAGQGKIQDHEQIIPNDNTWHTYTFSSESTLQQHVGGFQIFQNINEENARLYVDNLKVYYKPLTTNITFMIDTELVSTAQNVTTMGITPKQLVELAGDLSEYDSPTAVICGGVSYEPDDNSTMIKFPTGDEIVYIEAENPATAHLAKYRIDMKHTNPKASDLIIPESAGFTLDRNGDIVLDVGQTITLSTLSRLVIDEGDKDFVGFNTDPDATTALSSVSYVEGGKYTLYAIWKEQDVNRLYSIEFDTNSGWSMTSVKRADGTWQNLTTYLGGNGSLYKANYAAANPKPSLYEHGFITHNNDGYITLNFDVSDTTAADRVSSVIDEAVADPYFFIGALDKDIYIPRSSGIKKMIVRARVHGENILKRGKYLRVDNNTEPSYNPARFSLPQLYYTKSETETVGTYLQNCTVNLNTYGEGNWFTAEFNVSSIFNDTDDIHLMRFDLNDIIPTGSKLDIDYIRFIGGDVGSMVPQKDRTVIKIGNGESDTVNGIRVMASATNKIGLDHVEGGASDIGYMFASSSKWTKAGFNMSQLTMDIYNDASINRNNLVIAGYLRKDGVQNADWFEQNDQESFYTAVLSGIPVKDYNSPFIVRPFSKINGIYVYGEAFEISFLDVADKVYDKCSDVQKAYIDECRLEYENYLENVEVSDGIDAVFERAGVLKTPSAVVSNLVIPTNDTKPVYKSEGCYDVTMWKNGKLETLTVYTTGTYPAIIDKDGHLTSYYADEPCVVADKGDGTYYLKSLAHSKMGSEDGEHNGLNNSDIDFFDSETDTTSMFVKSVSNPASPVQRFVDSTSGVSSFFLGDTGYGTYEFTYSKANSATINWKNVAKTANTVNDMAFVAKYRYNGTSSEWVSYSKAQLDVMNNDYAQGLDYDHVTFVVKNNTSGVNATDKRDREDIVAVVGEIGVPSALEYTTASIEGSFEASLVREMHIKTTSSVSKVTVQFTRADGKTGKITSSCYGTTPDGYRVFDVDLYGIPEYHGTITKYIVGRNTYTSAMSGSYLNKIYLVQNGYSSSYNLTKISSVFDDGDFEKGFVVRDLDQKYASDPGLLSYFRTTPDGDYKWAIDPWYAYDYTNLSNKSSYQLSANGNVLSDASGSKLVQYNTGVDVNGKLSNTLTMTLNAKNIYNGRTQTEMENAGMTYWPHLLIEQDNKLVKIDPDNVPEYRTLGADRVLFEADIRMSSYSKTEDSDGRALCQFQLYTYLVPKDAPNQKIWIGMTFLNDKSIGGGFSWNRDTGASMKMFTLPQEIVWKGIDNSYVKEKSLLEQLRSDYDYKATADNTWKHIEVDLTNYLQTAIDWANREDTFGLGHTITLADCYINGVNIGYETHGNVDATIEIANFNINSYSVN